MITLRDLRSIWDEHQVTLAKTIGHLEAESRLHAVEAGAGQALGSWLETLRSWKRDVEALQTEHRKSG
jgi:hypothetical protein